MDSVSVLAICFPKQLKANEKMHSQKDYGKIRQPGKKLGAKQPKPKKKSSEANVHTQTHTSVCTHTTHMRVQDQSVNCL